MPLGSSTHRARSFTAKAGRQAAKLDPSDKAKSLEPIVKYLKTQRVTLYFLPPYSPELNRIERFWHATKFTWMVPKCRDSKMLEADVDEILDNFGIKYKLSLL